MEIKIVQPQDDMPEGHTDHCDHCGTLCKRDEDGYFEDAQETCSHTEPYLLLCRECYRKAGNTVR